MKWIRRSVIILLLFVVFVQSLTWVLSPTIVRMVLADELINRKVVLDEASSIRVNLFLSRITIRDLSWQRDSHNVFTLKQLSIKYTLYKLLAKKVQVDEVILDGLEAHIRIDDTEISNNQDSVPSNTIVIAGLDVLSASEEEPAAPASNETDNEKNSDAGFDFPFSISLPIIRLDNISIYVHHQEQVHDIVIDRLALNRSVFADAKLDSALTLKAKINGADFKLDSHATYRLNAEQTKAHEAETRLKLSVSDVRLNNYHYLFPESVGLPEATTGLKLSASMTKSTTGLSLNVDALSLLVENIAVINPDMDIAVSSLLLSIPSLTVLAEDSTNVAFKYKLDLNGIALNSVAGSPLESAQNQAKIDTLSTAAERLSLALKPSTDGQHLNIGLTEQSLNLAGLAYNQAQIQFGLEAFTLALPTATLTVLDSIQTDLNAGFHAAIGKLSLLDSANQSKLLDLGAITVDDGDVKLVNDDLAMTIGSLQLSDIIASTKPQSERIATNDTQGNEAIPPLLTLQQIALQNLQLNNTSLAVEQINIEAPVIELLLDKHGELATLVKMPELAEPKNNDAETEEQATQAKAAETVEAVDDKAESEFGIKLKSIVLSSAAKINIEDYKRKPAFKKNLSLEALNIANIQTDDLDAITSVDLKLTDGEYFSYIAELKAKPFTPKVNAEFSTQNNEFALQEIAPYVEGALGFDILAGQLDSNFSGKIVEDKISSVAKVDLRGAKFSSGDSPENEMDLIGQASIPLNVALDMLKDGKGNIRLKIPINGNIDDPSFGVHHILALVVKKAVMSQTKSHLIRTFVPYGQVLSVAMAAGSYALKVRFEDLAYSSGQTQLVEAQTQYFEQFIALMEKKQSLQVRICPVVTSTDLNQLGLRTLQPADSATIPATASGGDAQQVATAGAPQSQQEKSSLSDAQVFSTEGWSDVEKRNALDKLGQLRASEFKKAAIAKGIASSRLLICSPKIEQAAGASTRLELSI